jgi:hypothetical protein
MIKTLDILENKLRDIAICGVGDIDSVINAIIDECGGEKLYSFTRPGETIRSSAIISALNDNIDVFKKLYNKFHEFFIGVDSNDIFRTLAEVSSYDGSFNVAKYLLDEAITDKKPHNYSRDQIAGFMIQTISMINTSTENYKKLGAYKIAKYISETSEYRYADCVLALQKHGALYHTGMSKKEALAIISALIIDIY